MDGWMGERMGEWIHGCMGGWIASFFPSKGKKKKEGPEERRGEMMGKFSKEGMSSSSFRSVESFLHSFIHDE